MYTKRKKNGEISIVCANTYNSKNIHEPTLYSYARSRHHTRIQKRIKKTGKGEGKRGKAPYRTEPMGKIAPHKSMGSTRAVEQTIVPGTYLRGVGVLDTHTLREGYFLCDSQQQGTTTAVGTDTKKNCANECEHASVLTEGC